MKVIKLIVRDMHCVNCAMTLQALEDRLPGVSSIDASFRHQKVTIHFDESRISVKQICNAIAEAGYTPEFDD